MAVETRRKSDFARRLVDAGYEDFVVLSKEEASSVLTERRQELLEVIAGDDIESITDLAETVDRDVAAVHRDLDRLFEYGLVAYEERDGRKIPRPKHEHVFVEPLL